MLLRPHNLGDGYGILLECRWCLHLHAGTGCSTSDPDGQSTSSWLCAIGSNVREGWRVRATNRTKRPSMYPVFIEPKPHPAATSKPDPASNQANAGTNKQSGRKKHKARSQQPEASVWVDRPDGRRGRARFVS